MKTTLVFDNYRSSERYAVSGRMSVDQDIELYRGPGGRVWQQAGTGFSRPQRATLTIEVGGSDPEQAVQELLMDANAATRIESPFWSADVRRLTSGRPVATSDGYRVRLTWALASAMSFPAGAGAILAAGVSETSAATLSSGSSVDTNELNTSIASGSDDAEEDLDATGGGTNDVQHVEDFQYDGGSEATTHTVTYTPSSAGMLFIMFVVDNNNAPLSAAPSGLTWHTQNQEAGGSNETLYNLLYVEITAGMVGNQQSWDFDLDSARRATAFGVLLSGVDTASPITKSDIDIDLTDRTQVGGQSMASVTEGNGLLAMMSANDNAGATNLSVNTTNGFTQLVLDNTASNYQPNIYSGFQQASADGTYSAPVIDSDQSVGLTMHLLEIAGDGSGASGSLAASDDFEDDSVATGLPTGWTNEWVAASWEVADVDTRRCLRLLTGQTTHQRMAASLDAAGSLQNVEVFGVVRTDTHSSVSATTQVQNRLYARGGGSEDNETAVLVAIHGDDTLSVETYAGGTNTHLASPAFTWAADDWIALRLMVDGNNVRVKAWAPADPDNPTDDEPSSWTWEGTQTNVTGSGWVGVGSFAEDGNRAWDYIEVTDLDATTSVTNLFDETLELYHEDGGAGDQMVGLRFTNVALPDSASIESALLRFAVGGGDGGGSGLALRIRAEKPDSGTFTAADNDISDRTLTTASVKWEPGTWNTLDIGDTVETPDISALITEVLGASWSSGDALTFVIDEHPDNTATGADAKRVALAYDADPNDAPELSITYHDSAPAFTRQVSATLDDMEEVVSSGDVFEDSTDLELGHDDVQGAQIVGVRFRNVPLEPGAGISTAKLRFVANESGSQTVVVRIWAVDADNVSAFADANGSLSGLTKTSAYVDWEIPTWTAGQQDSNTTTPNLANLVQEVVDRPGWASGNALAFLIEMSPTDPGTGSPPRRAAVSYDNEPTQGPELAVNGDFDTGDSGGDTGDGGTATFSLTADTTFSTSDLDDSTTDASGRTQRDWYQIVLNDLTEMRSWHTNGENRPAGREGNADSTALLILFRLYGDLTLLDEIAARADAMYGVMSTDSNGYLAFDPGGQYDQPLDAPLTAGLVAAMAWALWVNRDETSPAGHDYEALATQWRDWLFDHYLPRWEGLENTAGQLPFIHKDQGHTFVNNMRTLYYMGQFGGGAGHSAQDYFDAVETMMNEKLGDEYHCSVGFNGRTTKIWRHSVNGTSTDSEARQYTSYVRYEVPAYMEFWMESIDPQDRITETWLTRVAHSIADHILDGDPESTGNQLASNIGGETTSDVCGVPYSDFRSRQNEQEWALGLLQGVEGWDSRGRITDLGTPMYDSYSGDKGVMVPAARVFTMGYHDGLGPDLGGGDGGSEEPVDGYYTVPSAGVAPSTYPDDSFYNTPRAFPGAEGWGANTTGGRGGVKCFVTTLSDDKSDLTAVSGVDNAYEGSFRACWEGRGLPNNQERYIIPLVSGYMEATERIRTDWGENDNWTYWGHFAPSPGLTIRYPDGTTPDYSLFDIRSSNFIVRFLRARGQASSGSDGNIDTVGSWDTVNFIYDHCSVSWGVDSTFDQREANYATVQWCLIYECLYDAGHPEGDHARLAGYGGSGDAEKISWHHNLSGGSDIRNPSVDSIGEATHLENNFVYNCDVYCSIRNVHSPSGEPHSINLRHNVAVNGPWGSSGDQPMFTIYEGAKFYVENNYDNARTSENDPQDACVEFTAGGGTQVSDPFTTPALRIYEPFENAQLLIDRCGATRPARDAVDDEFLSQFQHGLDGYPNRGTEGSSTSSGNRPEDNLFFPTLAENSISISTWVSNYDTWKSNNGYSGLDDNDTPPDGGGYTVLELYANSLIPDM